MAILLNGWILPVGGVASGRVCAQPAKQACLDEYTLMPKHVKPALQLCSVHGGPQEVEAWCGVRLHTVW